MNPELLYFGVGVIGKSLKTIFPTTVYNIYNQVVVHIFIKFNVPFCFYKIKPYRCVHYVLYVTKLIDSGKKVLIF